MHNTAHTMYNTKKWEANMKSMYYKHHTIKTNKTHLTNLTKYPQAIFNIIFSKTQQKHEIQEIKG